MKAAIGVLVGLVLLLSAGVVVFRRLLGHLDERAGDDAAWRAEERPPRGEGGGGS